MILTVCCIDRPENIGATVRDSNVVQYIRCISNYGLEDMKSKGCYYTWNNKQSDVSRVFCKLDRVRCNDNWSDMFSTAETWFLPEGSFDHSPMLLQVHQARRSGASPFRFYKMWCTTLGFLSKFREA